MGIGSNNACRRKEIVEKVRRVLEDMENVRVEARCCCTDKANPPAGKKVVDTGCLDGALGIPQIVSDDRTEKFIWIPPPVDNRQNLDPTMSCYAATVANQFYDQLKGCPLVCGPDGSAPHSHWWNKPMAVRGGAPQSAAPAARSDPDYCEDSSFVPPEPAGHQAWSYEPGGKCRHPQYCKAACFDHYPERDWSRR